MGKKSLVIFASGTGSNALNLVNFFATHPAVEVAFVLSNKSSAPVVEKAENLGIPVKVINNELAADAAEMLRICSPNEIDFIVLAGYLRKVPEAFVAAFPNKIINVHPSILPNYGGPGMYGKHVHEAVVKAKEAQSGITIHFVNEEYDQGAYIAQLYCSLEKDETPSTLASKIQQLEHHYFPIVVEQTVLKH